MKEETKNTEAINQATPVTATIAESVAALKEEIARLTEENASLAEKLKKSETDRETYKRMWSTLDDEYKQLMVLTKEMVKFAKLA